MKRSPWSRTLLSILLASTMLGPAGAQAPATPAAAPAAGQEQADEAFSRAELQKLLMPVALYPDPLLAQLLPAAAYPLEIVQAARWLDKNKDAAAKGDFAAADALPWDASVKALLRFPDVIRRMNDDLDWTSDLGDAFVNQPQDVASVIQDLRLSAQKSGALVTNKQQKVVKKKDAQREVIVIEPADPEVIYVPAYDPVVVYEETTGSAVAAGLIGFGTGILVGSLVNNNWWNWGSGSVYPPVWPGYPAWRPPYPGYRPGVPPYPGWRPGGGGNINIGNDINIGNGNGNVIGNGGNLIGNTKPWRPDPDRYRPGQGTKPGLANRDTTRPGANRPGGEGAARPLPAALGDKAGTRPDIAKPNLAKPNLAKPDVARPNIAKPDLQRPAVQKPAVAKPANKPARPEARPAVRPDSAFGGIEMGAGAAALGNRGAASRAGNVQRPGGGGGGGASFQRPAGGGGASIQRPPGGGGGGMARGGGGGGGGPRPRGR